MEELLAVLGLGLACVGWWWVQRLTALPRASCGGCNRCGESEDPESRLLREEPWRDREAERQ